MVTRVGILTVVRHTTKWQPALGLAEEKLQQQTKTSSAPLYKIKVSTGVPTKYLSYKDGLKVFLSIPFIMLKTIL